MLSLLIVLAGCSTSITQGAACDELGFTACDRLLACNLTFTDRELCVDQVVDECCADQAACGEPADEAVLTCTEGMETISCDDLAESPPASCANLL